MKGTKDVAITNVQTVFYAGDGGAITVESADGNIESGWLRSDSSLGTGGDIARCWQVCQNHWLEE
ncbi:hypothetical protein [Pseudanabaena sp. PCC 6802]|uniref:hypothetical protein n=1 Tax=Pseudanabaena sp. PCC 6802 TaxID=118173 RepID=UPI00035D7DC9|nr:hypothetical protein [Pseudanabaena sp. PCC 6802]